MKNIAIGVIPDDLSNIVVTVEWTPGEKGYDVCLLTPGGKLLAEHEYLCLAAGPIGYSPQPSDFDALVMRGLEPRMTLPARLTRTLALFSHFEWVSPVEMSRTDRAKFGAAK
ncbi:MULTISPECIES: hypothetical protein [unclassified Streptomyces]|uniref:hypothetical protein n=1 Tax=Streptomyces sp. NPDC055082 TaxID=3365718 RepID=UPI0037CE4F46